MSLSERFNQFRVNLSKRIAPKSVGDEYLNGISFYGGSSAGVNVTPLSAMRTSAVMGCYRVLTEGVASLPLILYKRLVRGKDRATNHPLFNLLRFEPNEEMSAYQWLATSVGHLILWGNMYSQVSVDGRGQVTGLWPIHPDRVWPQRNKETGAIEYKVVNDKGGTRIVKKELMFHVPLISFNGVTGVSLIGLDRMSVGLSVAAEEYGAAFFENGATPQYLLSHPTTLSPEAYKRLKDSWNEQHQGAKKAHGLQILEEGMSVEKISIPPNDAQFLETRKFQVDDIARIFRVPPHKIASLDKATFSNIEHQSLEFVTDSLRPLLILIEQGIHQQLLLKREKRIYLAEFLVDGLLRGDIASRNQAYATGRQWGWLSTNDIREKENMNPIENGDIYLQPLNMVEVGGSPTDLFGSQDDGRSAKPATHNMRETRAQDNAIAARRQSTLSWRPIIQDAAQRILKKEAADLKKLVKEAFTERNAYTFEQLVSHYYNQDFEQFIYKRIAGVFEGFGKEVALYAAQEIGDELADVVDEAYIEQFISRFTNAFIARHIADSKKRIDEAIARGKKEEETGLENGVQETLDAEFDNWDVREAEIAKDEGTQLNGAVAHKIFALAGVLRVGWRSFGDSCPYCKSLDGTVIGISESFLSAGVSFVVDDDTPPLVPRKNKSHPPAHGGCDCGIVAVL